MKSWADETLEEPTPGGSPERPSKRGRQDSEEPGAYANNWESSSWKDGDWNDNDKDDSDDDDGQEQAARDEGQRRYLQECRDHLGDEQVPRYDPVEIILSNEKLNELRCAKKRSYKTEDSDGNQIYIKKMTESSWVKITQWNTNCFRTTYLAMPDSDDWRKVEDRDSIHQWRPIPGTKVDLIIIVHKEHLTMPDGRNAPDLQPDPNRWKRRAFSKKQKEKNWSWTSYLAFAEEMQWDVLIAERAHEVQKLGKTKIPKTVGGSTDLSSKASTRLRDFASGTFHQHRHPHQPGVRGGMAGEPACALRDGRWGHALGEVPGGGLRADRA